MREWKGRGRVVHVRARRDRILAAMIARDVPQTTQEIAAAVGSHYGPVYADLRALCGSHTMPYSAHRGDGTAPGYPVVWSPWDSGPPGSSTWTLDPDYRADQAASTADLEAILALPTRE